MEQNSVERELWRKQKGDFVIELKENNENLINVTEENKKLKLTVEQQKNEIEKLKIVICSLKNNICKLQSQIKTLKSVISFM